VRLEEAVSFTSGTGGFSIRERGGRVTELVVSSELPNILFEGSINGVDGGDRMWIAPELDLFYDDASEPSTWRCPKELDPGSWTMEITARGVQLHQAPHLEARHPDTPQMIRTIEPLMRFAPAEKEAIRWSGYRITNRLIANRPWSAWQLLMLHSPAEVFVRNAHDPIVYYPPAPETLEGWTRADGEGPRWKVGFDPPSDSRCVIGVLSDDDPGSLVTVTADIPSGGTYVDRPPSGGRAAPIQIFDSGNEGFCEVEVHAPLESKVVESTVVAVWGDRSARLQLLETISKKGVNGR
jgi:hypothetical protein